MVHQGGRGTYTEAFKELIMRILQQNEFEEKRSSKLNQDDFLDLLAKFNEQGVHFS